jgi:hypothetical protein
MPVTRGQGSARTRWTGTSDRLGANGVAGNVARASLPLEQRTMKRYGCMTPWLVLCAVVGCTGTSPTEPCPTASVDQSRPTHLDDPFAHTPVPSDQPRDFDTLVRMIEDTIGSSIVEEQPPIPFSPPLNDRQVREAVQQCVDHAVTSPFLAHVRDFYGTPGDTEVVLVSNGPIMWPKGLRHEVGGLRLRFASATEMCGPDQDRKLGIRLDKLNVVGPVTRFMDGNIELVLTNVGGDRNGAVQGGCSVIYIVEKDEDAVVASCQMWIDP